MTPAGMNMACCCSNQLGDAVGFFWNNNNRYISVSSTEVNQLRGYAGPGSDIISYTVLSENWWSDTNPVTDYNLSVDDLQPYKVIFLATSFEQSPVPPYTPWFSYWPCELEVLSGWLAGNSRRLLVTHCHPTDWKQWAFNHDLAAIGVVASAKTTTPFKGTLYPDQPTYENDFTVRTDEALNFIRNPAGDYAQIFTLGASAIPIVDCVEGGCAVALESSQVLLVGDLDCFGYGDFLRFTKSYPDR